MIKNHQRFYKPLFPYVLSESMSLELPGEFKLSPGLTSDISLVRCSLQQRIP